MAASNSCCAATFWCFSQVITRPRCCVLIAFLMTLDRSDRDPLSIGKTRSIDLRSFAFYSNDQCSYCVVLPLSVDSSSRMQTNEHRWSKKNNSVHLPAKHAGHLTCFFVHVPGNGEPGCSPHTLADMSLYRSRKLQWHNWRDDLSLWKTKIWLSYGVTLSCWLVLITEWFFPIQLNLFVFHSFPSAFLSLSLSLRARSLVATLLSFSNIFNDDGI